MLASPCQTPYASSPAHPNPREWAVLELSKIALQWLKIDFGRVIPGPFHHVDGLKLQSFRKVALSSDNQHLDQGEDLHDGLVRGAIRFLVAGQQHSLPRLFQTLAHPLFEIRGDKQLGELLFLVPALPMHMHFQPVVDSEQELPVTLIRRYSN